MPAPSKLSDTGLASALTLTGRVVVARSEAICRPAVGKSSSPMTVGPLLPSTKDSSLMLRLSSGLTLPRVSALRITSPPAPTPMLGDPMPRRMMRSSCSCHLPILLRSGLARSISAASFLITPPPPIWKADRRTRPSLGQSMSLKGLGSSRKPAKLIAELSTLASSLSMCTFSRPPARPPLMCVASVGFTKGSGALVESCLAFFSFFSLIVVKLGAAFAKTSENLAPRLM